MSQVSTTPEPGAAPQVGERRRIDRRKHARYPVSGGGAEIRQQGVDSRIWARLTDISLGGCYLETMSPLPVLTYVNLGLILEEQHLNAKGQVVVAHPNFGMGIQFIDMSAADRKMLEGWLATLAPKVVTPIGRRGGENPARTLEKESAALLVQAVTEFYRNNATMSREEFLQLVEARRKAQEETKVGTPTPA